MSNAIVQATSHGSNGLLFAGWNQDQGKGCFTIVSVLKLYARGDSLPNFLA